MNIGTQRSESVAAHRAADPSTKCCQRCKRDQPLDDFYQKAPGRYDHWCKGCRRGERRTRYRNVSSPRNEIEDSQKIVALPSAHRIELPSERSPLPPAPKNDSDVEQAVSVNPSGAHPKLPQYTFDEVQRAVAVFEMLARWRDEERRKGTINW